MTKPPMTLFGRPTPEEHEALMAELGPLPLRGRAWPRGIALIAWLIMGLIAMRLVPVLGLGPADALPLPILASVLVCYAALLWMSWSMWTSVTEISAWGIRQSWITRREVAWTDIQSTKFIPLFASKKLVCFVSRGRPLFFQAGTPELQAAFARISLVYRRKT